jgi:hypothetical protein
MNTENLDPDFAFCMSFLYSKFTEPENVENSFDIAPYNWQKWEAFKAKFFRVIDAAGKGERVAEIPF